MARECWYERRIIIPMAAKSSIHVTVSLLWRCWRFPETTSPRKILSRFIATAVSASTSIRMSGTNHYFQCMSGLYLTTNRDESMLASLVISSRNSGSTYPCPCGSQIKAAVDTSWRSPALGHPAPSLARPSGSDIPINWWLEVCCRHLAAFGVFQSCDMLFLASSNR